MGSWFHRNPWRIQAFGTLGGALDGETDLTTLKPIFALAAAALLVGACTTTGNTERNALGGAALGGLAGAAIGAVSGDVGVGTGAAVGAAVGGGIGAVKGCREDGGCGAATPNRRQYYDERAGRYYYYDSGSGRYYWENGARR